MVVPAIGETGAVARGVQLDPDALKAGLLGCWFFSFGRFCLKVATYENPITENVMKIISLPFIVFGFINYVFLMVANLTGTPMIIGWMDGSSDAGEFAKYR